MSEIVKDSTIKLFGKTISLSPDIKVVSGIRVLDQQQSSSETSISSQGSKVCSALCQSIIVHTSAYFVRKEHEYNSINSSKETSADGSTSSGITDDLKAPNIEIRSLSPKTPTKEEQSERSVSPEKTVKKPDKLLPCPRCNSVDTKFCYYNNYNVQQPRYFCKNCQRYWTAGGVMRNVPVGSGRRKSKNAFAPNYHHGVNVSSLVPNGFVVFGSDAFLDESMTTSSHLDDKSRICTPNGLSPSGTRFAFYPPTPYWAGGPVQCPWAGPQVHQTPPILGKHSRDGVMIRSSNSEKENCLDSVLIPKTIRIHDPSDAAKSSIWSTLGIKNERIGSNDGRSLFKEFVAKGDRSSNVDNASLALQANPAAFSRSLRFQVSA